MRLRARHAGGLVWAPLWCAASGLVAAWAAPLTPIATIQGDGPRSPLVGQTVTTEGVVTRVLNNGYAIQSLQEDGDPRTSDGVWVHTGRQPKVAAGELLRLTAQVAEHPVGRGQDTLTQLVQPRDVQVRARAQHIAPTRLTLPLRHASDWEAFEGMLVHIDTPLTVTHNHFLARYGQLTLAAEGRLWAPTQRHAPGSAAARADEAQAATHTVVLDDGTSRQHPEPTPYLGPQGTVRVGDQLRGLTGVVDYGLITHDSKGPAGYRVHPVGPVRFEHVNPRPAMPPDVGGELRVASFNVQNYFNGDGLGGGFPTPRGARTPEAHALQRSKLVTALARLNADVLALTEIENDGEGPDSAIQDLLRALNTHVGTARYALVPAPGRRGASGRDAIKVALLYQPQRLQLAGSGHSDTRAIHSRAPLAQTFRHPAGGTFTVVVAHLKSKRCDRAAGDERDQGDGQACFNARRDRQAAALASFVGGLGDGPALIVGDLNAYARETPVRTLLAPGHVDLIDAHVGPQAYSYVYEGRSGYLDHALANAAMRALVTGAAHWHINADEPPMHAQSPGPYRSSDHDPVLIGLRRAPPR